MELGPYNALWIATASYVHTGLRMKRNHWNAKNKL